MPILLDTCAIIYLVTGESISAATLKNIESAAHDGELFVSPISAWEVGLLATKRRVHFAPEPKIWFQRFVARPGVALVPLSPETMLDAWFLPQWAHGDPADRLLVAVARDAGLTLVTSDRRILDYAAAGHLTALAC